jgi:hypothetical protein
VGGGGAQWEPPSPNKPPKPNMFFFISRHNRGLGACAAVQRLYWRGKYTVECVFQGGVC